MERIAIVSGGNRGIGRQVCHDLAARGLHVVLTARKAASGAEAAAALREEGLPVSFHQLDVTDATSVRRLTKEVADRYGRADVLVNNAAISMDEDGAALRVDLAVVRQTMETNFFAPLRLCQALIPLMQRHGYGRIVNVTSRMGSLAQMGGRHLGYRSSKTALNALTRVLAAELRGSNILANSVDPGWVRTEMGGMGAPRSVEEGAATIVWAATLPDGGPSGQFFRDRQEQAW